MPWWGWIALGVLVLVAAVAGDDWLYLAFLGVAALAIGALAWAGAPVPGWAEWLALLALSLAAILMLRDRPFALLRASTAHSDEQLAIGARLTVPTPLVSGDTCPIDLRGTTWQARNVGDATIGAGTQAEICGVEGLLILVRAPKQG